jgi:hypothetical protein
VPSWLAPTGGPFTSALAARMYDNVTALPPRIFGLPSRRPRSKYGIAGGPAWLIYWSIAVGTSPCLLASALTNACQAAGATRPSPINFSTASVLTALSGSSSAAIKG